MRITKFFGRNVHGALNFDVDFRRGISLLVGINGCGKTTVINLIGWVLSLKFGHLATTAFDFIVVGIEHNDEQIDFRVVRNGDVIEISAVGGKLSRLEPISVPVMETWLDEPTAAFARRRSEFYARMKPNEKERPLWDYIMSLPRTTHIALDRILSVDDGTSAYDDSFKQRRTSRAEDAISHVEEILSNVIISNNNQIFELDAALRHELLLSSFVPSSAVRAALTGDAVRNIRSIRRIERELAESLREPEQRSQLTEYFRQLREHWAAVESAGKDVNSDAYLQTEFLRLSRVAAAFERFSERKGAVQENFSAFLAVLNDLFRDTGKVLVPGKRSSRIRFTYLDENGASGKKMNSISRLSSGEQQILILLTYLAYPRDGSRVVIIDEPEISLHPRWQAGFIEAAKSILDPQVQLIVATHSPEVVGRNRDYAVLLPRQAHLPHLEKATGEGRSL